MSQVSGKVGRKLLSWAISTISLQEKTQKTTKHTFSVLENEIDLERLQIKYRYNRYNLE